MVIGLIQMIICRFGNIEPARGLVNEIIKIEGEGDIRLVDVLFVNKDAAGNVNPMDLSSFSPSEQMKYGSIIKSLIRAGSTGEEMELAGSGSGTWAAAGHSYGISAADVQEITDNLAVDDAVGFFLIEHTWTPGFLDALSQAGGQMIAQGFLSHQALSMVEGEIENQVDARGAIIKSEDVQRESAMDALVSAATSRAMREETSLRAAEMLVEEGIIGGEAMDDAARIVAEAMRIEEALNEESTTW
ncbi:MAG: hypothetical protein BMS9Abin02_1042 [Anaerolineae bacterium]|nr:MAG: hypothetical protein BMS9Abin02_1042 [Anaerolineae bacterium]